MPNNHSSLPLIVENLTFRYERRDKPAIKNISFSIHPGQIVLLAGSSGCGKTTLMRCINGLAPNIYKGEMTGKISVFGHDVTQMSLLQLSQYVGTLLQDPERQIVASHVLNEVAFGLENLGIPRLRILQRVEKTLEYLGIDHLKDRETFKLSGGEKQKVALAGVLVMEPKLLLLDEPLASLDPASAAEALSMFKRLAEDGISILLVEHRVEDVLAIHPDVIIYMEEGEITYHGDVKGFLEIADFSKVKLPAEVVAQRAKSVHFPPLSRQFTPETSSELLRFENVTFQYHPEILPTLKNINFSIHKGEVTAILGHNGAGKTTLVKHALGLLKPTKGTVYLDGKDTKTITIAEAAHTIGYVFQSPTQMLFAPTVEQELAFGPQNLGFSPQEIQQNVDWALQTVHLENEKRTPPLALSFGQQKRVSIASILSMKSRILMMDEPTAGQDYWNYHSFMSSILEMPGYDAVLFITHDLDLAITYANRIILMANGEIIRDGSPEEVLRDIETLKNAHVLPTSLLSLNLKLFDRTRKFLRAELLANFI
ncbi:ABC transporter ATP-binding protein [Anaerolinea sp.]|uniref:ABC transporter ATP-binding protein n=1 Tax=Anaerolinea sp. TaxID=1872519 RepID=UPI002ACD75A6|nr:ABC transporter ATP-binding protein [Anaerolinea sp.]